MRQNKGAALSLSKGFSLIELMVVIAIIGVLTSIGIVSFSQARNKANIAKAKGDLNALRTAVSNLELDTGLLPGMLVPPAGCIENPETDLSTAQGGIISSNGGAFPNWSGPYMSTVPKDPWGGNYYFDPDYTCAPTVPGCENVPNTGTTNARVLASWGKTGGPNVYDADNIVVVLCSL